MPGVHRHAVVDDRVDGGHRLGVEREDKQGRQRAELRNFEFFAAPHVAVVCMPEGFGVGVALDVGIYLQTLMLALQSRGIASCAQASLRCFASLIREELEITSELRIMAGVSFGYPLVGAQVNDVRQTRAELHENVTFIERSESH